MAVVFIRYGRIWEDHLTDSDGQYIEFQAGRQFVQYREDQQTIALSEKLHLNHTFQTNGRSIGFQFKKLEG